MERIAMSQTERDDLDWLKRVEAGSMTQREAAEKNRRSSAPGSALALFPPANHDRTCPTAPVRRIQFVAVSKHARLRSFAPCSSTIPRRSSIRATSLFRRESRAVWLTVPQQRSARTYHEGRPPTSIRGTFYLAGSRNFLFGSDIKGRALISRQLFGQRHADGGCVTAPEVVSDFRS
jgi:hypothetical protein